MRHIWLTNPEAICEGDNERLESGNPIPEMGDEVPLDDGLYTIHLNGRSWWVEVVDETIYTIVELNDQPIENG